MRSSKYSRLQRYPLNLCVGRHSALIVQEALANGVLINFATFFRCAEEGVDFLGLQYMIKAGYDPVALVRFLERLQENP